MIPFVSGQCRINDNGKCSDRCGPRGPCVILNRWILEFRCQRQTLPMYFTHGKQTLFAETKLNFSFCLGSCSAWKYILHCKFLKSFDIQLSLSTHSSCWGAPFGIFTHNFCLFWQTHALLQNVLNVALEWLISEVWNSKGGPHDISENGGARRPPRSLPLISTPAYISYTNVGNGLRTNLSLITTNSSGERSFSKLKVVEWTNERAACRSSNHCMRLLSFAKNYIFVFYFLLLLQSVEIL